MQMLLRTTSSAEAYIANQEWRAARLPVCPLHPQGGCSFAHHGSYLRATPPGLRVARWYCPEGHRTFSLLPDFLAARLPGLLDTNSGLLGDGAIGQELGVRRGSGSRAGGDITWGDPLAAPPRASCSSWDCCPRRPHAGTADRRRQGRPSSRIAPIPPDCGVGHRSRAARIWGSPSDRRWARSTQDGA